jgi:hypothetical protein
VTLFCSFLCRCLCGGVLRISSDIEKYLLVVSSIVYDTSSSAVVVSVIKKKCSVAVSHVLTAVSMCYYNYYHYWTMCCKFIELSLSS